MAELHIKKSEREEFDEQVWQTNTYFTQGQYNEWLENATDTLAEIYDTYDGKADVYILGDVINMLKNIKIKIDKD